MENLLIAFLNKILHVGAYQTAPTVCMFKLARTRSQLILLHSSCTNNFEWMFQQDLQQLNTVYTITHYNGATVYKQITE